MIKAEFNKSNVVVRHDFPLELQQDEQLTLKGTDRPIESIELVEGPGGQAPSIGDDNTVTFHTVGRYHLRVIDSTMRHDLHCVAFEPALLAFVENHTRSLGHGGAAVDGAKIRSIVRSLCTAPWFDGTVASVTTGEPHRNLNQFGC